MVRYDTPTDGISRKKFDRAMDSHIRRYATAMEAILALEKGQARLWRALGITRGHGSEEEE